MNDKSRKRSRGGGREARRELRSSQALNTKNKPYIKRNIPVYDLVSDEVCEMIEENALIILEEIGIDFRDDAEALSILKSNGCDVKGERVRFPRGLCHKWIAHAPAQFTQYARNKNNSVEIGGNNTVFAPVYGPPFIRSLDGERRYATIKDFQDIVKLAYMSPGIHHSGGTVCEPVDLPVTKRHLEMNYSHMRLSDKPFMGSVTAPERARDTIDMAKILFGDDFVKNNTVMISLINANSPMTWDGTMLGALKEYARSNQAVITTPFILSGAMAPVTPVGVLAQTLAEAMSGITFAQMINPGTPVVFGSFASSISMQSGAPTFGTPEPAIVLFAAAKLARRLGVPFRSGGSLNGAKIPDAQAAIESLNTLWPTVLGGVNFVLHAAGWLEGGLVSDIRKFIIDADQCSAMSVLTEGPDVTANGQAMDAIREVGPGQHFLGCNHTQKNFEKAFWTSKVSDNTTFEQWSSEGETNHMDRAGVIAKRLLEEYTPPEIDPSIDEELRSFIDKKKEELPNTET
jgi:trimethylamine--corrinoid protein Co-methyltransferase